MPPEFGAVMARIFGASGHFFDIFTLFTLIFFTSYVYLIVFERGVFKLEGKKLNYSESCLSVFCTFRFKRITTGMMQSRPLKSGLLRSLKILESPGIGKRKFLALESP